VPPYDDSDENPSTTITIADDKGNAARFIEYDGRVVDLVVAPDGRYIFVVAPGSSDGVLDAETDKRIFQHSSNEMRAFGFSPDGTRFAVVCMEEPQIRFYDTATGRQSDSIPCEPDSVTNWIQFSPDGKCVATSYQNEAASTYGVSIYDMATKQRIQRITGHTGFVHAACFSADGRRLFTKSSDGTVRLWDVENGFELLSFSDGGNVRYLPGSALARDGRMIAIASPEGVYLKETATPEQVAAWQTPSTQPTDTNWWKRLGGIQDWLVLAPIHLGQHEDLSDDLDLQQLKGEADVDPNAGEIAPVDGEELIWKQVPTSDCVLDLQKVTSPDEDHCLAYAVTHIYSDESRVGVRLLVGSDDLAKIYLNGKAIYEFRKRRAAIPADDEILIDLRKGKNVLVYKVIDDERDWGVSAQVVGQDYQPIPGVTTGTNP
jgi:WD40 repeat protein